MADGGSGDIQRGNQTNKSKEIPRRDFLKLIGGLGILTVTGEGVRVLTSQKGQQGTAQASSAQPSTPTEISTVTPSPTAIVTATPTPTETPKTIEELSEELVKGITANAPVFANCSVDEKQVALEKVWAQIDHYIKPENKKDLNRVMKWKKDVNIDTCFNEVSQRLKDMEYTVDPRIKDWILPLIMVESDGRKGEESTQKAIGLCQITEETAIELARALKLPYKAGDLLDPAKNITYAIAFLSRQLYVFGDEGLAFWTYNLGHGNIQKFMDSYLLSKGYHSDRLQLKTYDKQRKPKYGTAMVTKNRGINYINLVGSKSNEEWERWDKENNTHHYVTRLVAAQCLLKAKEQGIALKRKAA